MFRTTICILAFSLTMATPAGAATDEERCQAAKLNALRKRTFCLEGERRKEILGKTPDTAKCTKKFARAIMRAGTSCRWLDNEDGTATDLSSGLQWELKTDDESLHDKDNTYTWSTSPKETTPTGTAFVDFLGTLNGGASADGSTTTGCFAGKCDWRLPTIEELRSILEAQYPDCASMPCTTIPGETLTSWYWSSSTDLANPFHAWAVLFAIGFTADDAKNFAASARAVRDGS